MPEEAGWASAAIRREDNLIHNSTLVFLVLLFLIVFVELLSFYHKFLTKFKLIAEFNDLYETDTTILTNIRMTHNDLPSRDHENAASNGGSKLYNEPTNVRRC